MEKDFFLNEQISVFVELFPLFMGKISYNLGDLWNVLTFLIYFLKFENKSENSANFPQIYEIFLLSVVKSMLPTL